MSEAAAGNDVRAGSGPAGHAGPDDERAGGDRRVEGRLWPIVDSLLIFLGLLILALLPASLFGDDVVRYQAVESFARDRLITDTKYSFWGPLFAVPLWFLGDALGDPQDAVERFNLILFTLGLAWMWWGLKDRVDPALLRRFLLLLIAGSMFPARLLGFGAEVFTAVLITIGTLAVVLHERFRGWVAVGVGVANAPGALAGGLLMSLKRCLDTRHGRHLLAFFIAAAFIASEAWLRFGHPVPTGYAGDRGVATVLPYSGRPGFSYPLFFGLLGILLSFGKGLVFFAPGMFLPARRALEKIAPELWPLLIMWLLFTTGLVLVYARWWAWYGGLTWGPRFFLFASVPASLVLAVRLHDPPTKLVPNLVTLGAVALSCWVAVSGVVYGDTGFDVCSQDSYAFEHLCWYVPEFSALWRPFVIGGAVGGRQLAFMSFVAAVFVRLAVPLLGPIYNAATEIATRLRARSADEERWRF